jgi:hypothetical protein
MDSILDMLEEPIIENSLLIAKQLIGKNVRVYLVMLTVIAFLLIMVYMMIKHVKRLPKYYGIEIVDIFGKKIVLTEIGLKNFIIRMGGTYTLIFVQSGVHSDLHLIYIKVEP